MLVQCEFYEVDGEVYCDVICEHCGEVALKWILREQVIEDMVLMGKEPILCEQCKDSKCDICGRFPRPGDEWLPGGNCWECQRAIDLIRMAWVSADKCDGCHRPSDDCHCQELESCGSSGYEGD